MLLWQYYEKLSARDLHFKVSKLYWVEYEQTDLIVLSCHLSDTMWHLGSDQPWTVTTDRSYHADTIATDTAHNWLQY